MLMIGMRMMMTTIRELQKQWEQIPPYPGGYLLVSGNHPLSFHIGYCDDGRKTFIVLNTGNKNEVVSSKAITAQYIQTEETKISLRFSLNYTSLDEIFVKLCWDLMDASRNTESPVEKIVAQYKKWMRLLQEVHTGIMIPSLQKGLIGELLYFKDKLACMNPNQVLNAWVGPEGSDQDFVFEDMWAEIKTVSISAQDVQISSLQQLARSDLGFLVVFFMDKTTTSGLQTISLPEIVEEVRGVFTNETMLDKLNCKLAKYGYCDKDVDKYAEIRFRYTEHRIYNVDPNFPKLTKENIDVAVIEAHYRLSLPMLEKRRIWED